MPGDDPRSLTKWYDAVSEGYDGLYGGEQEKKYSRVLEAIGSRQLELLIDVGCGTGKLLDLLAPRSNVTIGIDVSSKMLARAKQRVKDFPVQFVRADAANVPVRDHIADGVTSISVTKTGPNMKNQLEELSRIASRNSTIVITILKEENQPIPDDFERTGARVLAELSDRERLFLVDHTQQSNIP